MPDTFSGSRPGLKSPVPPIRIEINENILVFCDVPRCEQLSVALSPVKSSFALTIC